MSAKPKQFRPLKAVSEKMGFKDLIYPAVISLKIDGVYGLNLGGKLLGRSLKAMKNEWLTDTFSKDKFKGICGEICFADLGHMDTETPEMANAFEGRSDLFLNRQDLCRTTTSKVNTIKGGHFPLVWVLFDYVGDGSEEYCYNVEYVDRMFDLTRKLHDTANCAYVKAHEILGFTYHEYMADGQTLVIPEARIVKDADELEEIYSQAIEAGYEGIVARQPQGAYKFGRSTMKSQELARFKPEGDSEIVVISFEPMFENNNEAKINELGHTERSSHKENKVQLGMVGAMVGIDINTLAVVKIGAGRMDHEERALVWRNRDEYRGRLSKYLFMDTGIKDAPRHPRFSMWRSATDVELSEEVYAKIAEYNITVK